MNTQFKPTHWHDNWYASLLLVLLGAMAVGTAVMMGIADNIPGIGVLYVGLGLWVLAIVWSWNRPLQYGRLLLFSILGFPVFVLLHNFFYALGIIFADYTLLVGLFGATEVVTFLLAILVCPVTAVVGGLGLITTLVSAKINE